MPPFSTVLYGCCSEGASNLIVEYIWWHWHLRARVCQPRPCGTRHSLGVGVVCVLGGGGTRSLVSGKTSASFRALQLWLKFCSDYPGSAGHKHLFGSATILDLELSQLAGRHRSVPNMACEDRAEGRTPASATVRGTNLGTLDTCPSSRTAWK